jgi:CHAD domain-containing protein
MVQMNPILLNWKKEQKNFNQQLQLLHRKLDKDAVHELRVAVKKLRAYLEMYIMIKEKNEEDGTWMRNLFTETEGLFTVSGRQRDIEICLEVLKTIQEERSLTFLSLLLYLKSLLKITKAWTNDAIHQYKRKELPRIALALKQDQESADAADVYEQISNIINNHVALLRPCFKKPHLLRKKLKLIHYWLQLLPVNKKYQPDQLHKILDELGRWQDYQVLQTRVNHFRKDYLPKTFKENETLKELSVYCKETMKELLAGALKKTGKYIREVEREIIEHD